MRPILMKGHERPLTFLKYNREGDLLFSCAKDRTPTVWFADNGERLGTYRGHNGAAWCCDVSRDSRLLITVSADQTVKLWNVQTGAQLYTFNFDSPARAVDFSVGDKLAVITTDPFIYSLRRLGFFIYVVMAVMLFCREWTIISAGEDAVIRIWDAETGKLLKESDQEVGHKKTITSLTKSADGSHFLTGSLDKSAKVVLGGGQDASAVTTTDHRVGKFEAKFYDKILQKEIGGVKGHCGPINALAFNPDGKSFSSGGEDGYVRLHHFDPDYFNIKI
ncbi:Eukaryotic translation initiation factor 3 subunit I [Turnera subulata]|uniref:Serine-threonine kinase receptor-associated protein n=1 Tax=Turnera subulata TaxID=218843 RepID=A0A9Q0J5W6_9ROSI|nr:Eukaryotic translation initiation factor 3 subunit I [Turnera subulata]